MKREQAVDVVLNSFIDISIVCAVCGVFYRVDLQAEAMEVSIARGEVAMMNTSLDADIFYEQRPDRGLRAAYLAHR